MMKWLCKNKWYILIAVFITVFIMPFVINVSFKISAPLYFLEAEWQASDVLTFYGSILAGSLTVVGVFLSIRCSQHSYKEDARNRVRPYLAVSILSKKMKLRPLHPPDPPTDEDSSMNAKDCQETYEEFINDMFYIIVSNDGIAYQTELTEKQLFLKKKFGHGVINGSDGRKYETCGECSSHTLIVTNVGLGAAVNFTLQLGTPNEKDSYRVPRTLNIGETVHVNIYFENPISIKTREYTLSFRYHDINNEEYLQEFPVTISEENDSERQDSGKLLIGIDLAGVQERIDKKSKKDLKWKK